MHSSGVSRAAEAAVPYGPGVRLNVVVPAPARAALEALAAEERRTVSEVCRELLERGLEERRRARLYRQVAEDYPARRKLYLDLIRTWEGVDEEVRRPLAPTGRP